MKPLDARLQAVLTFIRAEAHADIGTDHARLPIALIESERCVSVIAIELNPGPLALAQAAVSGSRLAGQIEVRRGDGFAPIAPGEVESASLTGMGARKMLGILERAEHLPPALILQPNAEPEALRGWALKHGYHLKAEALIPGFWRYPVMKFAAASGDDLAYSGLPHSAALKFGPHLLKSRDTHLWAELTAQQRRLSVLAAHGRPGVLGQLTAVQDALALL